MRAEIIVSNSAKVDKEMKADWKLCGRKCGADTGCQAWMWNMISQECSTASEAPTEVDILVQSFLSGSRDCDGKELYIETAEKNIEREG